MATGTAIGTNIGNEESCRFARDLLTTHPAQERIDCCIGLLGYTFVGGRSSATAALHPVSETGDWSGTHGNYGKSAAKQWTYLPETRRIGSFKGARFLLSATSAGIGWHEIDGITTHEQVTGRLIADFRPRQDRVPGTVATAAIGGCADMVVDVEMAPV